MAAITVRNLSDETHRALKARALVHGRSTEAEVRAILNDAVTEGPTGFGTRLVGIAADVGGFDDVEFTRDHSSTEPPDFS